MRSKILNKDKTPIEFGISTLDNSLGGGIPRGSIVLIEDHVEIGTIIDGLLMQFLAEGLRKGEYAYLLSTDHPFEHYAEILTALGVNPKITMETRRLMYIDVFTDPFSWGEFRPEITQHFVRDISKTRELYEVVRRAILHCGFEHTRGVIDCLSTLVFSTDTTKAILGYLHHQVTAHKKYGRTSLITIHSDVHDPYFVKVLEHLADGVIQFKKIESDEYAPFLTSLKIIKMSDVDFNREELLYDFSRGRVEVAEKT